MKNNLRKQLLSEEKHTVLETKHTQIDSLNTSGESLTSFLTFSHTMTLSTDEERLQTEKERFRRLFEWITSGFPIIFHPEITTLKFLHAFTQTLLKMSGHQRWRWVCFFIRSGEMCLSNGCSGVNGCHQNESQWMLWSEWVPSEWESMDALEWMGAIRMRVNGCSRVNGCRQNESQWMLWSEWVPSEWESMDALEWMGAVRMRVW